MRTGVLHMLGALVGCLALCGAFVVVTRYFAVRGECGWVVVSCLVPAGVLAGLAASAVTVVAFTGAAVLALAWLTVVSARLARG